MSLKRGDIYFAELNPVQGSEQGGMRPVLVVQNDVGNNYSPSLHLVGGVVCILAGDAEVKADFWFRTRGTYSDKAAIGLGVTVKDVPVGFKYIGEQIKLMEESGRGSFLLGFEESQ